MVSSILVGACDSTQWVTRSILKTTFSRAFRELATVVVGARDRVTAIGSHKIDQLCKTPRLVDERDTIAVS